jgi:hypothetical protein
MTSDAAAELARRILELLREQARARGQRRRLRWLFDGTESDVEIEPVNASTLRVTSDSEAFEVRVQLVLPPARQAAVQPWQPGSLDLEPEEVKQLSYVVVDEIVGDVARVSVSSWPGVDRRGRLHFNLRERARSVRARVDALEDFVARQRPGRRRAPLRMGAVLAAGVDESVLPDAESEEELTAEAAAAPRRPEEWLRPPIHDISADAREKAKEAYYAAVSPTTRPASEK